MRRRALLAASAIVGSNGGELPTIPDGFFPLYLTHDSYDYNGRQAEYTFNPTDTTQELWNIVYGYATILCEYDGLGYDFYPEDYGIEVYLDGMLITNFYVYNDGHADIIVGDNWLEGNIYENGLISYIEYR